MVVGAVQGASCFGPAYEFALLANADLRRRKIRDRVPITFVTSKPYTGHLGLGGVGDTKGLLESMLRDRDIRWITNAKLDRIDPEGVAVTEVGEDGNAERQHRLLFIPAFRGVSGMTGEDGKPVTGLVNPCGFVLIDKFQRNPKFRNVFAVGVRVAISPYEQTPVAVGVPKTGYMIESMVSALAENIRSLTAGKEPEREPTWNAVCLADFGDAGVAFIALPQIPPRNVNCAAQGYWVHVAKVAFEKYSCARYARGGASPFMSG
jgi:sulfide:quinone oxidoreductase